MQISEISIKRPVLATVMNLVILLIGLIAFFIPVLEISEAPRENHFTAVLRPLGENWTEFSVVRVAYAGSSEPAVPPERLAEVLEQQAAELRETRPTAERTP